MDELATAATPIIKIRDNWTVVDSAVLKRARKRLIKRVAPAAALAATLTEVVQVEDVEHQAVVGASLLKVRDQLRTAAVRGPSRCRPAWRPRCATTSATGSAGWPSSPSSGSAPASPTTWGWARRSR